MGSPATCRTWRRGSSTASSCGCSSARTSGGRAASRRLRGAVVEVASAEGAMAGSCDAVSAGALASLCRPRRRVAAGDKQHMGLRTPNVCTEPYCRHEAPGGARADVRFRTVSAAAAKTSTVTGSFGGVIGGAIFGRGRWAKVVPAAAEGSMNNPEMRLEAERSLAFAEACERLAETPAEMATVLQLERQAMAMLTAADRADRAM